MKERSITELQEEMVRVKKILDTTQNPTLRRDYSLHYKRLSRQLGILRKKVR